VKRLAYCKICGQPRRQDVTLALCDSCMLAYWRKRWHQRQRKVGQVKRDKLTVEQVREIRVQRAGGVQLKILAERYGVTTYTIYLIAKRRRWTWVA
jgi:hypothetical protein